MEESDHCLAVSTCNNGRIRKPASSQRYDITRKMHPKRINFPQQRHSEKNYSHILPPHKLTYKTSQSILHHVTRMIHVSDNEKLVHVS